MLGTRAVLIVGLMALVARAKEIQIPDRCEGPVCITNLIWKKGVGRGFTPHVLSGTVTTKKPIESITLTLNFRDDKRNGQVELTLDNVAERQDFNFRVSSNYDGIVWDRSSLVLTAWAIHNIAPVTKDAINCRFGVQGHRLKLELDNKSSDDLILDYGLLTLTAGPENHRLNGIGGRYIEFDKPKTNALIPAGTTFFDQVVPIEAVKLINNQWIESTMMNLLLTMPDLAIHIPLSTNGKVHVERFPLDVVKSTLLIEAIVDEKK